MPILKINIVLPFPVTKPGGGAKIMYEYANRLFEKGHDIYIYHSIKRPFKKSKTPVWIKQLIFFFRNVARPKWFPLHKNIVCKIVPEITDSHIRNADIILSTWWQMTYAVSALNNLKGKKFNLIQGHEIWVGHEEAVLNSYKLPINHLVISKYLQILVEKKSGKSPVYLPNALNTDEFFDIKNHELRDAFTLIMLFSNEPIKGTEYGLQALELVHKKYPQLKVILFGVFLQPENLPSYITYYQNPENLNLLYNTASIFFSPSNGEGWALPPAEAMACGCAVVCTEIGGHLDYAVDGKSALLVQPKDINNMSEKILSLLTNTTLRNLIAQNGHQLITTSFSWDRSTKKLEDCLYNSLKD